MNNRIFLENEKKYQLTALAGAGLACGLVFLLLFLVTLSGTVPVPPVIEFVEVNFGTDDVGSGSLQTLNKASDSPNPENVKREEDVPNPKVTTTSRVEKIPPAPVPVVEKARPSRVITEKPDIASKVESPVTTPEKAEPKKIVSSAPKPSPAPPRVEPVARPEPKVDNSALFKRSGSAGSNGTAGRGAGVGGNNNGDNASGVGDKGNPEGKVDAKSLYGAPGGTGSGVSLNISGWGLGSRPQVDDDSDETGKIVFQIKVDDRGDILSVRTMETTVSAAVVEVYKRAVQRVRLVPKSSVTPPVSTGTITFIIKSK